MTRYDRSLSIYTTRDHDQDVTANVSVECLGSGSLSADCVIRGHWSPGDAGSYHTPPSGDCMEAQGLQVLSAYGYDRDGEVGYQVDRTRPHHADWLDVLAAWIWSSQHPERWDDQLREYGKPAACDCHGKITIGSHCPKCGR